MDVIVGSDGSMSCDSLPNVLRPSAENRHWTVDLRRMTSIDAAGLVTLAALCDLARVVRAKVRLREPEDRRTCAELTDLGLAHILMQLGVAHRMAIRRRRGADELRVVRQFATEQGVELTTQRVLDHLLEWDGRTHALYGPMFELGMNAVDHSGRSEGYLAAEVLPSGHASFAIADAGVGIRNRLTQFGKAPAGDAEAITMAARRHVSSAKGRGRGRGISGVIELAGTHNGRVVLVSGAAQVVFERGHWDPRRVVALAAPLGGTLAQAQLLC